MSIILVIYFILGCLMDELAILLITLPITFPLVTSGSASTRSGTA